MDLERFRGLIAIQDAVSAAGGSLQSVMDAIVGERSVMMQSNGIVVELRDGDQLYYAAASGTSADLIGLRLPLNASLSGMSILTGQPLYCEDSENDSRVNRAACRKVGLRSMIVVPIPHRGQTVGVLKYYSADQAAFDAEDMTIAHLLVGPIAVGLSSVAEADAIKAQTELQNVVRLKEQFLSTVSHELRTPITSISGSLSLLEAGVAGDMPEKASSLVAIAARNADRLKRLVNDLLDMDRLDSGKLSFDLTDVDLRGVLTNVVEQNEPFAKEAGVRLDLKMPVMPVMATIDPERLFQAVTNLVSNAAKFSPAGSVVMVELDASGPQARIRVVDQGPGVPVEFRQRLFDRFAQSDHTRGMTSLPGTGLGLAIAKSIVDQLGGTIRLDENVASGAAFEIALPLSMSGAAGVAA
jgi:signal transduction histidine kinase